MYTSTAACNKQFQFGFIAFNQIKPSYSNKSVWELKTRETISVAQTKPHKRLAGVKTGENANDSMAVKLAPQRKLTWTVSVQTLGPSGTMFCLASTEYCCDRPPTGEKRKKTEKGEEERERERKRFLSHHVAAYCWGSNTDPQSPPPHPSLPNRNKQSPPPSF